MCSNLLLYLTPGSRYLSQTEKKIAVAKVLFTHHCRRQNFCPILLRLVERQCRIHCCKRLGRKFCLLQQWVNSTLQAEEIHKMTTLSVIFFFDLLSLFLRLR